MTRNLKALGLALFALFAMGAMTASAASAADLFTTGKEHAILTGTSHDNIFTTTWNNSSFKCTTSQFTATTEEIENPTTKTKEVVATVLPSYTGIPKKTPHETKCEATIGTVTVDMNDCHYVLTGNTTKEDLKDKTGKKDAEVWITCPSGKEIEITGPLGCIVSVPGVTPTEGGVIYTNIVGGTVTVTATVTGITYTANAACQLAGFTKEDNDADYVGTVTVAGWEDKSVKGELTKPVEGSALSISVS
jgi:hypothetical protein